MYELDLGDIYSLKYPDAVIDDINIRFRHTYILGTTGVGKTTLMERMALYDIKYGCACIFIDPKGKHAKRLYSRIPDKDRVIYLSLNHPNIVINPLRREGYELDDLAEEFVDIINIYIDLKSPANPPTTDNMKDVFWNVIESVKKSDMNLDFLQDFLRYKSKRETYLKKIGKYNEYWKEYGKKQGSFNSSESETGKKVAIRLTKFLKNKKFLRIIKGEDTLNIEDIAQNKKVLLVDLSGMKDDLKILLTSMISCAIKTYCETRRPEECNDPLMFYFDECWMGINESFKFLLSDARDYEIGFTLANQYIKQFKNLDTIEMISGLCNTKIGFLLPGENEAKLMANAMDLKSRDFKDLDEFDAWVRIINKNSLITTYPPLKVDKIESPPIPPEHPPEQKVNFLKEGWITALSGIM